MRKYWLLLLSLFMMNGAYSQTTNPLRDSLNLADKELIMRPDSIDLRLKKAGGTWNWESGSMPRPNMTSYSSISPTTLQLYILGLLSI